MEIYKVIMSFMMIQSSVYAVNFITAHQCIRLLHTKSLRPLVLDLSAASSYKKCHLTGSVHVDYAQVSKWSKKHYKRYHKKMIIVICSTPKQLASIAAANFLEQHGGYADVVYVQDGLMSLKSSPELWSPARCLD